jgi:branched-subunit amino acid aminotransferase/4-amino-4-deoxychorismate lyase
MTAVLVSPQLLLCPACLPVLQANKAGVDEALMLDPHGFVATCNSVNFFIVREGQVRYSAVLVRGPQYCSLYEEHGG